MLCMSGHNFKSQGITNMVPSWAVCRPAGFSNNLFSDVPELAPPSEKPDVPLRKLSDMACPGPAASTFSGGIRACVCFSVF